MDVSLASRLQRDVSRRKWILSRKFELADKQIRKVKQTRGVSSELIFEWVVCWKLTYRDCLIFVNCLHTSLASSMPFTADCLLQISNAKILPQMMRCSADSGQTCLYCALEREQMLPYLNWSSKTIPTHYYCRLSTRWLKTCVNRSVVLLNFQGQKGPIWGHAPGVPYRHICTIHWWPEWVWQTSVC